MTRKILCALLVLFSGLVFLLLPVMSSRSFAARSIRIDYDSQGAFELADLALTENGLRFRLKGGEIALDQENQLIAPGLNGRTQEPAAPSIPFYSTWIILPPGASISVTLDQPNWTTSGIRDFSRAEREEFPGQSTLGILEAPPVTESALVTGQAVPAYEQDAFYPRGLFDYSEPMYVRDIRLVKLSIYPIRYNPVQKHLERADNITANVTFTNVDTSVSKTAPSHGDLHGSSLSGQVLNWDQAASWRGLPKDDLVLPTQLPIGVDVFKIEVDSDAVYQIGYSDLKAAGMDVDNTDPNTFEMLYRGQPVSFHFDGNEDAIFQRGEYIYFYGWAFDGPRIEKQFVTNNVFWLWAGGTPSHIDNVDSVPGEPVDSFNATVTREPENIWFASWTDEWEYFPNEPDAWYWDRFSKSVSAPITWTYQITLPNPSAVGQDALVTAELSSMNSPQPGGNPIPHVVHLFLNDDSRYGSSQWYGIKNLNITITVPITRLNQGVNQIDVVLATNSPVYYSNYVYLNRLSVNYRQELAAVGDQLAFNSESSGPQEFSIGGFNNGSLSDVITWNISDELRPVSIISNTVSVTGTGPYTYTFGSNHSPGAEFIITTVSNVITPTAISNFNFESLDPEPAGADWVAVSYSGFITEVERLATHRRETFFGSMDTHVVDVSSIINQYGYGLALPSAIQDYLIHALTTWDLPPSYLLLVGDSTINPRNNLNKGKPFWVPQLVPTDLAFVDRFQGQIPSDHIYSLLSGDDLLPDLAVGRIPVKSTDELSSVIDKIVLFEHNQLLPVDWMQNILYLSDKYDPGAGDFCFENQQVSDRFPDSFNHVELCLTSNPTITDVVDLRTQFFTQTNVVGTTIVNYRGHGGVLEWGGYPTPTLSTDHVDLWENPHRPVVIVSGDCLDGYFAYPPAEGLAETFIRADEKGSAAHWSSSGLGFSAEHSELVEELYDGLFLAGLTAIGDAANYAKMRYFQNGGHPSLLYSFILEGDPAMQMMRRALSVEKQTSTSVAHRGDLIEYSINVLNSGIYPSHVVVTDTLPTGLSFITATSSLSATITFVGSDIIFELQFDEAVRNKGLPRGATATITITAEVDQTNVGGAFSNLARVGGTGLEAWPGDEFDSVSVYVIHDVLLPALYNE